MLARRRWAVYLCAVGVERGLCVVCLYRFGVELKGIVPFLVPEGIVALVLELGGFVGRGTHDVSTQCGTSWVMRGTRAAGVVAEGATGWCTCWLTGGKLRPCALRDLNSKPVTYGNKMKVTCRPHCPPKVIKRVCPAIAWPCR